MTLRRVVALTLALLVLTPCGAFAQAPASPPPASASADQLLKPEQLDALVAPIALYPDTLLRLGLIRIEDFDHFLVEAYEQMR
jgi:hypothetical protein